MEHLLQKSKCTIFHNIFKYMIVQKALLLSKGIIDFSFLTNYDKAKLNEFEYKSVAFPRITIEFPDYRDARVMQFA